MYHAPVLLAESIEALAIKPGGTYLDGTVGGGGHFLEILNGLSGTGTAVGIDRDAEAVEHVRTGVCAGGVRVVLAQARFSEFERVLREHAVPALDGVILDLGVSSHQIDTPERGFSYQSDAPLDMRMDSRTGRTARELLREVDMHTLADILASYGEVRNAPRMAGVLHAVASCGGLATTGDLRRCLEGEYGALKPKVLSKVYQALRIAVNGELDELQRFLERISASMNTGGRLVVISYHSLEDRMVKNALRAGEGRCVCPPGLPVCQCNARTEFKRITRKAVKPGDDEVARNRRARSARLRVAEKV